jgi:type I restriction enzyme S subunit
MKSPWPTKKLGDKEYFEILGSGIEKFEGEKEYLSTSSIEGNKIIAPEDKIGYWNRPSRANMQPRLNSVWFARMINTIKVYSFTEANKDEIDKYILSTGFAGILCNPEKVDSRYLEKIFLSRWFNDLKDSLASDKAIQKSLNNDDIANLEIPLPPLPIQQKIVKILDTIQSAVEIQEKIIEKTKELKKSLMNLLFHYGLAGLRVKELMSSRVGELTSSEIEKLGLRLKKTEVGEIPEDWEVVRLGDKRLFEIKLGGTPKTSVSDYWNGKIPWITPNDLSELTTPYIEDTQRKISTSGLKAGSTLLPENSIILSTRAPIGYIALLRKPMAFNQGCKGIVIKEKKVVSLFLYYFLLSKVKLLQELGTGSTFKELATSDLENLKIPLPPLPEQQEIAEVLQTIDQKIEIEKKKKELYEELFKTMLNKIMNQEIDVEKIEI